MQELKGQRKMIRGFWWLIYNLFARHLPRSNVRYHLFSKVIRAFVVKRLLRKTGSKVNIEPKVFFYNMSESEIGDYSGIGMNSSIGTIRIGRNVMIGERLIAISNNHAFNDKHKPIVEQGFQEDRPIAIEDDVWIGARVILLPGICIGKGSVVGAGSVVTKDIPEYSIVAGNPATVLKSRI